MLLNPSLNELREYVGSRRCAIDIGLWQLSDRAVGGVGWGSHSHSHFFFFLRRLLQGVLLVSRLWFGAWRTPTVVQSMVGQLRVKIATLPEARLFRFRTTAELVFSMTPIQSAESLQDDFWSSRMP
ncbi:putative fucose kinase [Trypanosoma rangeli]|uniref:Putative fucose kinase n=1 Tax=Trypanosoma rangeli TaxID=5698 RepID=A0A3R7LRK2_TRYRA|nr:putative fucose kinase [Trypanosoma rangeli]RNF01993.1 putative fucose kinase [Trypanosoma rangeli]|eukprot:RNF01993.1 putative fucose kinase [Trypanosoma rangeli]